MEQTWIGFEFDYGGHHLRIEEWHNGGWLARATDVNPPWFGGWGFLTSHLEHIKEAMEAGREYPQDL